MLVDGDGLPAALGGEEGLVVHRVLEETFQAIVAVFVLARGADEARYGDFVHT